MEWNFGFNNVKVKDESRRMFELCLKRADSIGRDTYLRTQGRVSLRKIFYTDMMNFLVYLAYSDGSLQPEETKYMNMLLGLMLTDKEYSRYAEDWGLKSEAIFEKLPLSLEPFVRSNIGPETGEISSSYYDLIMLYITTFNYIGNDFIACNKDVSSNEIASLSKYIGFLRFGVDEINKEITTERPTIAFAPGSKIKDDSEPDYKKIDADEYNDDRAYGELGEKKTSFTLKLKNDQNKEMLEENSEKNSDQEKQTLDRSTEKCAEDMVEEVNLESLLKELNELTGMESVKNEVNNLVNLLKICKIRKEKGLQVPPTTNHMVFLGNPGTGKTTVARILSKIYQGLGILTKGHLVEVDRSGLVAGYMGQTSEKVMEVIEEAKGGILFIDEAYALSSGKQEGDFGQEAIDILNKAMEDNRDDLIVIAAGYHDEMQDFLDANPGLRSRFNRTIEFPNYTADELVTIMCNRAAKLDYHFSVEAMEYVSDYFTRILMDPPQNFGNARSVRNYLERIINNQANRLVTESNLAEKDLMELSIEDAESVELQ